MFLNLYIRHQDSLESKLAMPCMPGLYMDKLMPNSATFFRISAALFFSISCLASIVDQCNDEGYDAYALSDSETAEEQPSIAELYFVSRNYKGPTKIIEKVFGDETIAALIPDGVYYQPWDIEMPPEPVCRLAMKISRRFFQLMEEPDPFEALKKLEFRSFCLFHSQPQFRNSIKHEKVPTGQLLNVLSIMFPQMHEAEWPGGPNSLVSFHSDTVYVSLLKLYRKIMANSSQPQASVQVMTENQQGESSLFNGFNHDIFTQILVAIFQAHPHSFAKIRQLSKLIYAFCPLKKVYPLVSLSRFALYARLSCGESAQFEEYARDRKGIFSCVPAEHHRKLLRSLFAVHVDHPHMVVFRYRYFLLNNEAQVLKSLEESANRRRGACNLLVKFSEYSQLYEPCQFYDKYQDAVNALLACMSQNSYFDQEYFSVFVTLITNLELFTTRELMKEIKRFQRGQQSLEEVLKKISNHHPILGKPRNILRTILP